MRRNYELYSYSTDRRAPPLDRTYRVERPDRSWRSRERNEKEFTKLNTDKATVLAILKAEPDYRPPRPMKPRRPPSSIYCEYHDDTGYTTDACFQLSSLIESKIRRGQLIHFVDDTSHPPSRTHDHDRVIDVIVGKAPKRPTPNPTPIIAFSDEDYPSGMIESHQDALIVTAKIGTNTVKKILIDNGSSVDILYHHAYSRMDLGDRKMENVNIPMYGFTGNEVKIVGTIDLPILFGTSPCQTWQMIKFHVVNAASSYNAILGRTTLTALKAIT
ncbi:hypothetical protein POM88_028436 [Heracleum sosnowskyi]|uniref:Peptidase A2 domain-containing protein n=1 Tax=Heracleum sosnowskyi TaxID=360622 RepID=A0AAD8MHL5_9APIA|nr:hypothetical protein POM88_028436 [Heracleum sosnowskyi]